MDSLINKRSLLTFFLLLFIFSACRKSDTIAPEDNHPYTKSLVSFKFEKNLNQPYLNETIEADIKDGEIRLVIPDSVDLTDLVTTFKYKGEAVYVHSKKQKSGVTTNDFSKDSLTYVVKKKDGGEVTYLVKIYKTQKSGLKSVLPHLYINLDNADSITSKDDYIKANIRIDGKGAYPDYEGRTKIRGRGNSTWKMPKKPYKLKLIHQAALLGLYPHKKWILLANYLDGSLLMNSIPFTMGHMLGLPYTNHIIPVELTINGKYQGFYVFTEQKEVGKERVDIGKDDGELLELDRTFDEDWQFHSDSFYLPVIIKNPKLRDLAHATAQADFNKLKSDFNAFEKLVADSSFPHNNYLDYFDKESYVDYLIVYFLTDNEDINRPRSVYLNRKKEGKYRMGMIWDFDYGFTFQQTGAKHWDPNVTNRSLFWSESYASNNDLNPYGMRFLSKFLQDPKITMLLKQRWIWFKNNKFSLLKQHVKAYAETIRPAYDKDHGKWGPRDSSDDLDQDLILCLNWLNARAQYVEVYIKSL